jgi:prepilin-type N-terminal cleavage/methylation domain-containing protein
MNKHGFTLVELIVGAAVASIIAVAIFALMNAGVILSAKNLSLNLTSNSLRGALDRVEQAVQRGDSMPQLVDNNGAPVSAGAAPGIKFDLYVGSPFIITAGAGGLPASTTTLTLTRSTNAIASPPPPRPGDVIVIANTSASLRPRIQSVTTGAVDAQLRQPFTITLDAPLGTAVVPTAGTILSSKLVRSVGFMVRPSNGCQELRYYDTFDTTTNYDDPTRYVLITDKLGDDAADTTPFSLAQIEGKTFLNLSLRVRASDTDKGIRGRQRDSFNTYNRVETVVRPKTVP